MARYLKNVQKLRAVFEAVPDHLLEQLKGAMEFGAVNAPDELPYDQLLELIDEQLSSRSAPLLLTPEQEVQVDQDLPPISGHDVHSVEPLLLTDPIEETPPPFPEELEYEFPRNAMHAFFSPMAGVIVDPPVYETRVEGYICSTSLPAIWRFLNEEESGVGIRDAWLRAEARSGQQEPDFYRAIALKMHLAARFVIDRTLRQSRENPALRRALMNRLGGKVVFSDLQELQSLLPVAMPFQTAYANIKSLVDRQPTDDWSEVAILISKCAVELPALAGYLQLSVVASLGEPWLALGLQERLAQECVPGVQGYNLIAEHFRSDIESHADWAIPSSGIEVPDKHVSKNIIEFGQKLEGLSQFGGSPIGLDRTLQEAKERLVRYYLKSVTACSNAVKAALAWREASDEDGVLDIKWLMDDPEYGQKSRLCQDALKFLIKTEGLAHFLGEADVWLGALGVIENDLLSCRDQLEGRIRDMEGDERFEALKLSDHIAELIGLVLGEESQRQATTLFADASVA